VTGADGDGEPQRLIPVRTHVVAVHRTAGQIRQQLRHGLATEGVEPAILEVARREGAAIRPAAGLLVSPPAAISHSWIEVESEHGWRAADPFYLRALVRWGLLSPDDWPDHRAPFGVHWRLWVSDGPLAVDHDTPLEPIVVAH
jgi:hypothetical protein